MRKQFLSILGLSLFLLGCEGVALKAQNEETTSTVIEEVESTTKIEEENSEETTSYRDIYNDPSYIASEKTIDLYIFQYDSYGVLASVDFGSPARINKAIYKDLKPVPGEIYTLTYTGLLLEQQEFPATYIIIYGENKNIELKNKAVIEETYVKDIIDDEKYHVTWHDFYTTGTYVLTEDGFSFLNELDLETKIYVSKNVEDKVCGLFTFNPYEKPELILRINR